MKSRVQKTVTKNPKTKQRKGKIDLFSYFRPDKKKFATFSIFTTAYMFVLYRGKTSPNETYRMALAGSGASVLVDCSFYTLDTLNSRMKVGD